MRVLGQRAHRSARDKLTVVLQWIKKAKEGYSKYLKVILKNIFDMAFAILTYDNIYYPFYLIEWFHMAGHSKDEVYIVLWHFLCD